MVVTKLGSPQPRALPGMGPGPVSPRPPAPQVPPWDSQEVSSVGCAAQSNQGPTQGQVRPCAVCCRLSPWDS